MKRKITFFIGLVFIAMTSVTAQNGTQQLTVDEAVRIALEKNLSLQRQTIDLGIRQRTANRSWNSLIPNVTAGALLSHPTSVTDIIPEPLNVWTPGVSVSASLNLSVGMFNTIKKTKIDYEAGLLTYQQARQELELQVRKLFYQIILLEANKVLAAQSLASAQARHDQVVNFGRTGQASRLEEMSARVDMENQRPNALQAERLYANALDSFKTLLDIPREQEIVLSGTLQFDGGSLLIETIHANPIETAVLQKHIQSLEAQRNAARNGIYIPYLRLSWNSMPLYSTSRDQWNDSGSFSITLGMNLDNLLPWSAAQTQTAAFNDNIRSAEIQLSENIRNSTSRILQYQRTIEQTQETITALKRNVELAKTAYELYEEAWRSGATDYQKVRDASDSLLQARYRVQQEQYNLIAAILDLEKEINIPFGSTK